MKKIFKIVSIVVLNVMILGTTCFASENAIVTLPTEIHVDGGKLELVGVENEDLQIFREYEE